MRCGRPRSGSAGCWPASPWSGCRTRRPRADAVTRFARQCDGRLVVKPLAHGTILEEGPSKALFTHRLSTADLIDLAGVDATAHLFQQLIIDKVFEVRLTVVGRRVFAAALRSDSAAGQVDWRRDYSALRYRVIEPPDPVTKGVAAFMDEFGLNFGAFDFAVDTEGVWWFFECNSAGQFRFVEQATGLPITSALADLLEGARHDH